MRKKQQAEKLRANPNQDHREESTDTHFASWWRRVTSLAGLLLISSVLLGSQAAAKDLTPKKYMDRNCTDKNIINWKPAGGERPPCDLWKDVASSCIKKIKGRPLWKNDHECYNKGNNKLNNHVKPPVVIVAPVKKGCHFMAVPTVPVIGIEDKHYRSKHPYWTYAWDAATLPAKYPNRMKKYKYRQVGLAVNPVAHRTQHQLHIHIGKVPPDIKKKLLDYLPNPGKWSGMFKIKTKDCVKKYIRGTKVPDVFQEVSDHAGDQKMKNLGIILAGHVDKKGHLDGFIILSCENACVERWLDYTCPHH
jgi:CDP-diacylglycerol pyrophosphatase